MLMSYMGFGATTKKGLEAGLTKETVIKMQQIGRMADLPSSPKSSTPRAA